MLSAGDVLRDMEARLLQTGGTHVGARVADVDHRDEIGRLRITLEYPSGYQLQVALTVDVAPGWPMWVHYRIHLQDRTRQCIFRYDNAPHHPELPTHPHHRHVGPQEVAQAAHCPTLGSLVTEVAQAVGGSPAP